MLGCSGVGCVVLGCFRVAVLRWMGCIPVRLYKVMYYFDVVLHLLSCCITQWFSDPLCAAVVTAITVMYNTLVQ